MNIVDRVVAGYNAAVEGASRRSKMFDHLWRARARYNEVLGGRLAAAIAYYAFFAVFALLLLVLSILGFVAFYNIEFQEAINTFLRTNLALLPTSLFVDNRTNTGVVAAIGLVFTGIGWVEAMRSSQRLMYDLDQQPGNLIIRRLVDLGMLVALFLLAGLSIAAETGIRSALRWLFGDGLVGLSATGLVLTYLVNIVLAGALLSAVPRLRISPRRIWPPVLLYALGITVLNALTRLLVTRFADNPAYKIVFATAALLVYLYLFNQLMLFAAALAATSPHGRVMDLAAGPQPKEDEAEVDDAAGPGGPGEGDPKAKQTRERG